MPSLKKAELRIESATIASGVVYLVHTLIPDANLRTSFNLIRAKSTYLNSAGVLCSPQAKMRPIEQVRDPSLNVERNMCF